MKRKHSQNTGNQGTPFVKGMQTFASNTLDFLFPRSCVVCGDLLLKKEMEVCWSCWSELPFSLHGYGPDNPLAKSLFGRIALHGAYYFLLYERGASVSKVLKAIKYEGAKTMAFRLGEEIGRKLLKSNSTGPFSHLIPIPMHPKKEKIRGYNPACILAQGISKSMGIPVVENFLVKGKETSSQTLRGRLDRWYQTEGNFECNFKGEKFTHPVLVDDVFTTGATIERCLEALYLVSFPKASVISLALTV